MRTGTSHANSPWALQRENEGSGRNDWPRVAVVHSFYRSDSPSGENDTVVRQFRMLADHGVDVALLSVSTDALASSPGYKIRTALGVASGRGLDPSSILFDLAPDIVHVHNLFPNISTKWLASHRGPIVASLHNYRPACAAATLSLDGHDCRRCPDGSSVQAVVHACYHGSRLATIPLALRTRRGAPWDPLLSRADLLLAPSPTMRNTYADLGVDGIRVLYQPTDSVPTQSSPPRAEEEWVFVGRLTQEKGIDSLLKVWPEERPLTILGGGPLLDQLRGEVVQRRLNVDVRGFVSGMERDAALDRATGLLFPSLWREGAPAVYAEALARGVPVIALKGNAVADMVAEHSTGVTLPLLETGVLRAAMQHVQYRRTELSKTCLSVHQQFFTVESWLVGLSKMYSTAISANNGAIMNHSPRLAP